MPCACTATARPSHPFSAGWALALSGVLLSAPGARAQSPDTAPAPAGEAAAPAAEHAPCSGRPAPDARKVLSFLALEVPWGWGAAALSGASFLGTALLWANQASDFPPLADLSVSVPTWAWRVGVGVMLLSALGWGALAVALVVVPEIGLVRRWVTGDPATCDHGGAKKKCC